MAEDRGGLQYTIRIVDEFSASTAAFVEQIAASKVALAEFQAQAKAGAGVAKTLRDIAAAQKDVASATAGAASSSRARKDALTEEEQQLQQLAAEAKAQRDLEREAVRIRNAQTRDAAAAARERAAAERAASQDAARSAADQEKAEQRALRAFADSQKQRERIAQQVNRQGRADSEANDQAELQAVQDLADRRAAIEEQAVRLRKAAAAEAAARPATVEEKSEERVNALIERRAVAQAEIARLKSLGREDLITGQLRAQAGEVERAEGSASRLLFTFRRLVGVLALFTIAREVVQRFRDLVSGGVQFNEEIRQAEISIAGLITGLADVRNAQGNSVDLAREYAAAQVEARRQVNLLRQDSLRTTATFSELLKTFQTAIGPGFAAGLNLDQIRKLSVSISQAATALGVPQNQLAEEIRSLVQGTIQARTTRIATALQITNADIKRLRETGQLFDFLEKRFQGLSLAAEKAARQTLEGIGGLVKNALGGILGGAAEPLFQELIQLGNDLFDKVLTIRNAAGEIRPNPQAVEAFKALFDGLRDGVRSAVDLGRALGFQGLRNVLGTIGTGLAAGLQFALGFAEELLKVFSDIVEVLKELGKLVGLSNDGLGDATRIVGRLTAAFLLLKTTAALTGFTIKDAAFNLGRSFGILKKIIDSLGLAEAFAPLLEGGIIGAALGAALAGFQKIAEAIFGVNLNLTDTVKLLTFGFAGGFSQLQTNIAKLLVEAGGKLKKAFSSEDEQKFIDARIQGTLKALTDNENATQKFFDDLISKTVNHARESTGIIPPEKNAQAAGAAVREFGQIVSNAESVIAKANTALGELDTELFKVTRELGAASAHPGLEGVAGQVAELFGTASVDNAVKLREVNDALTQSLLARDEAIKKLGLSQGRLAEIEAAANAPAQKRQAALEALNLTPEEGRLVSLLRDEALLRDKISTVEEEALTIARTRAAIVIEQQLPALRQQNAALEVQLQAEQNVTDAVVSRAGARRIAAIQAENELEAARKENSAARERLVAQIEFLRLQATPVTGLATKEDRDAERQRTAAIQGEINGLEKQLELNDAIAEAKQRQLAFAAEQARLASEGTFSAGVRAGFEQLANDLPNLFDAAKNIVVDITNQFVSAAGQIFRDLFDPRTTQTIGEAVGELGLSIAQTIFQNTVASLIQSLISNLLTTQATEVTTAVTVETIKNAGAAVRNAEAIATAETVALILATAGLASGGLVPTSFFASGGPVGRTVNDVRSIVSHRQARGYASGAGGGRRAASDTVPAWLTPGEFVIRKSVVDSLGVGFFRSVNNGGFSPPRSGAPAGDVGMAAGGLVTTRNAPAKQQKGGDVQILPVQVAGERELDRMLAGGKIAFLKNVKDNASDVRTLLGL